MTIARDALVVVADLIECAECWWLPKCLPHSLNCAPHVLRGHIGRRVDDLEDAVDWFAFVLGFHPRSLTSRWRLGTVRPAIGDAARLKIRAQTFKKFFDLLDRRGEADFLSLLRLLQRREAKHLL